MSPSRKLTKKRSIKPEELADEPSRKRMEIIISRINKLGEEFERIYSDKSKKTDRDRNKALQTLLVEYYNLRRHIPETYYPAITNDKFNDIIARHPLFQLYRVEKDATRDSELVESYKTNKDTLKMRAMAEPYFILTPTQKFLRNFLSPQTPYRGLFIWHGTGVGKCHAKGTQIMLHNGTCKRVEHIVVGDCVMGSRSECRHVLSLGKGYDTMYAIKICHSIPISASNVVRNYDNKYIVNSEHILVLYNVSTGERRNMEVRDYIEKFGTAGCEWRLLKTSIMWPIGNYVAMSVEASYKCGTELATAREERVRECMINSIFNRVHFMRGVVDKYGELLSGGSIIMINDRVGMYYDAIIWVSRSLGYSAIVDMGRLYIWGDYVKYLHVATEDAQIYYSALCETIETQYEFIVERSGWGKYYGFTLDGNHEYILGDYTINHNTCTAISIAENLKAMDGLDEMGGRERVKITILRQDEFIRQMVDISKIRSGNPEKQCTGGVYLRNVRLQTYLRRCMDGKEDDCVELEKRVKRDIRQQYNLTNPEKWANGVRNKLEYMTKGMTRKDREVKIVKLIRELFNNTVLIIDEAHNYIIDKSGGQLSHVKGATDVSDDISLLLEDAPDIPLKPLAAMTGTSDADDDDSEDISGIPETNAATGGRKDKLVTSILKVVVKYAQNMRLILMTATPMFDTAGDIISYLNYLLMNDKRPLLVKGDIFDGAGNLKASGAAKLVAASRGYISYLRGNSPFDFPLRLSARHNVGDMMLNLAKYPKKDLSGGVITERIQFLELVACQMLSNQLKIMELYDKDTHKTAISAAITNKEGEPKVKAGGITDSNGNDGDGDDGSDAAKLALLEEEIDVETNAVAYSDEKQIANYVYQSIDEANGNIVNCYGRRGLASISRRKTVGSSVTYTFNDSEYGKRFLNPELKKWSSKLAFILENIKKSTGPVFIYSYYVPAGVIPLAFMLEMNGYQRYKMHSTPLLNNPYKLEHGVGDYILYTADQQLSMYAKEYLDLGARMVKESIVRVFIGSGKSSEGLNLLGYREVYILDPWDHINKLEQSIGRVIRQGSHMHLPPQQRNVTVYLCAATMAAKESRDLSIYRRCEKKAIVSGAVEKILKENAIDCVLNFESNQYTAARFPDKVPVITSQGKEIMVSLADEEYSKFCFYQKNCEYRCTARGTQVPLSHEMTSIPYMTKDYDKMVEEMAQKMKYLLLKYGNISVDIMKRRLGVTSSARRSGDMFNSAIARLLAMDIMDKTGETKYSIVMTDDKLRLIPITLSRDVSIYRQMHPERMHMAGHRERGDEMTFGVGLKSYLTQLDANKSEYQKTQDLTITEVMTDINRRFNAFKAARGNDATVNIRVTDQEIMSLVYNRLSYLQKMTLLRRLVAKMVQKQKMVEREELLEPIIRRYNIVYYEMIYPEEKERSGAIYGFILANVATVELYEYNEETRDYTLDSGNMRRYVELFRKHRKGVSKVHGFIKYENLDSAAILRIVDRNKNGEKESVKGMVCNSVNKEHIRDYLRMFGLTHRGSSKISECNDIEVCFMRKSDADKALYWFLCPEEYLLINQRAV
jgi:hypothetical protein